MARSGPAGPTCGYSGATLPPCPGADRLARRGPRGQTGAVPDAAPAPADRTPAYRADLHASGLRATEARLLLLRAIERLDHPTVEALHRATEAHGIALTTVYRTLETLERAGLVWAVHVPGTGRTYHLGSHRPHAHLLCSRCGLLEDLRGLPEDALAACGVPAGFAVEHVQLTVIGHCPACAALLARRGEAAR